MKYLSVCSGIEAATVAWHPLGWTPAAFAEIEKFPSAVLAHHYPSVPNLGDMTRFKEWPDAAVDVLVGGTPCQSFSVAGLRAGLADPRGNLALTYLAIADRYRPSWLVWENVPGVLSSSGGRDFGAFLGGLGELGYGFAYRVLDAQYFGLAQRRRRVFVVGHLGDWRRAAAVLFERESLSGHPAPRREAGKTAPTIPSRSTAGGGLGTDFDCDGGLIPERARALTAGNQRLDSETETFVPVLAQTLTTGGTGERGYNDPTNATLIPEPLTLAIRGRGDSHDLEYRQDGTANAILTPNGGRAGIGVGAVAIQGAATRENPASGPDGVGVRDDDCAYTLEARSEVQAVAFANTAGDTDLGYRVEQAPPITGRHGDPGNVLRGGMAVRRLTPRECERLQGFRDDYTLIPFRGKPAADGPRYKALGNSMAVPVMHWIGKRIALVESLACDAERVSA